MNRLSTSKDAINFPCIDELHVLISLTKVKESILMNVDGPNNDEVGGDH